MSDRESSRWTGQIAAIVFVVLLAACANGESTPETTFDTASQTTTTTAQTTTTTSPEPAVETTQAVATEAIGAWSSFGFDHSNTMHNRDEVRISPANVDGLVEAWRLDSGAVTGTPIVTDGTAYFGDWHGVVRAVEARTGAAIWEADVTEVPISATVAVTDRLVIAGDLGGVLHARDRATGAAVWTTNMNPLGASLFASPVVIDDAVVIGMTDTELGADDPGFRAAVVAINLTDGSERWRLPTNPDDAPGNWVPVWSSVAYDPERRMIYVGTGDTNQPGSGGPGSAAERAGFDLPLADGVLAIDFESGEIAWFFKLVEKDNRRDFDVGASPNLFAIGDRDVVGVGGKSGEYVVLDRDTGTMIWKTRLTAGSDFGGVMSSAAVDDGAIYVASNDGGRAATLFALDAEDGSIVWQLNVDHQVVGSMALANGVLYRGTFGSTVMAIEASTGAVLWTDEVDGPMGGGSSIAGGMLYVGYGVSPALGPAPGGVIAYSIP